MPCFAAWAAVGDTGSSLSFLTSLLKVPLYSSAAREVYCEKEAASFSAH